VLSFQSIIIVVIIIIIIIIIMNCRCRYALATDTAVYSIVIYISDRQRLSHHQHQQPR